MERARRALATDSGESDHTAALRELVEPAPFAPRSGPGAGFEIPSHAMEFRLGWIGEDEERADGQAYEARRQRSLQTCHRYALYERRRFAPPEETGAFVPAASARIENDRNLTDGARRCARKLLEETYRRNRAGRVLDITVSYLAKGLGRCRRTIQRYLRLLEREGYIGVEVVKGERSRLCTGLAIYLLGPVFPRHHRKKWPQRPANPGATQESQNQRFIDIRYRKAERIPRRIWALQCMDGVFRAFMKTDPLGESAAAAPG